MLKEYKIIVDDAEFLSWSPNTEKIQDPKDPEKEIPKYTDEEWIAEKIRQRIHIPIEMNNKKEAQKVVSFSLAKGKVEKIK